MTFIQLQSRNASLNLRQDAITAVLEVKDQQLPFRTQVQVGQSTYMVSETFDQVMAKITGESPVPEYIATAIAKQFDDKKKPSTSTKKSSAPTKKTTTKKRR
jgi:hypothetical protein